MEEAAAVVTTEEAMEEATEEAMEEAMVVTMEEATEEATEVVARLALLSGDNAAVQDGLVLLAASLGHAARRTSGIRSASTRVVVAANQS